MRKFQILIVSAVKICKQCLQTASASGGSRHHTGALRLNPTGGLPSPNHLGYNPQMKILGVAIVSGTRRLRTNTRSMQVDR